MALGLAPEEPHPPPLSHGVSVLGSNATGRPMGVLPADARPGLPPGATPSPKAHCDLVSTIGLEDRGHRVTRKLVVRLLAPASQAAGVMVEAA
jgi:hypothetical protein